MRRVYHSRTDVSGAREEILNLIQRDRNKNINIYFYGWQGFGAPVVLRSIAQVVPSMKAPPPRLCFGTTIYIDCSRCTSKRAMQKVIAQQLRLDYKTMAMFDEQDEEDDFNGVDLGSRDTIRDVAAVIDQNLREIRFMMIFINGSDEEEVFLGRLGVPENSDCVILWTFSARLVTMRGLLYEHEIAKKLRNTDVFLYTKHGPNSLSSPLSALFREEAANIVARYPCMGGMDLTRVVDCCLFGLLLTYHSSRSTTGFAWPAHAPNFWICDGIIPGNRAWEISNALHPEISFECHGSDQLDYMLNRLTRDPKTPFFIVDNRLDGKAIVYEKRPCRWLSVIFSRYSRAHKRVSNKERTQELMQLQTTMAGASSIFLLAFLETKDSPVGLPNGLFKQCNNLGVLVLSCCAFSFLSPPFVHCHTLRFLGLDHCTDDNTTEFEGEGCTTKWAFLKSLWVIDLYFTNWVEILSEEKIELMANLMELNIEGVRWLWWRSSHQLQKRLPNLRRLRIIRPTYDDAAAETSSSDISNPFLLDSTSLEILDLSGSNRLIGRNLAGSISKAIRLQVLILDGCDGLEDVMLSSNFSLRSFSLDGYGPASSHRASTVELPPEMSRSKRPPAYAHNKTSIVSLQGCARLDNLFLRGLPNLVELDLSGCAIKVLDFGSMVVDVPMLKRLFLIGCEGLRAIKWGSARNLRMVCIDTRPGSGRPTFLGAQRRYLQMHAVTTDARLIRSLCAPIINAYYAYEPRFSFNIRITSSAACSSTRAVLQHEETSSKETMMIGPIEQQRQHPAANAGPLLYGDIFTKVGDGPTPMQAFPQAPTEQSDCHIEIGAGSRSVQGETEALGFTTNLASLMSSYTESVHVHDVSTCSRAMPGDNWECLRWCRVERCRNLHTIFPPGAQDFGGELETIWASDLLMAGCVWSKARIDYDRRYLKSLKHLHLRCCPSLRFALVVSRGRPSFPSLETLHIIHCGDLRHVFVLEDEKIQHTSVQFPKLTTIHLHDLPALRQICEATATLAPTLETIKIRGCWSLRRLPALKGREPGMKKTTVEIEKDVWDALEWDGVDAGHHPSLYEAPVHSRYYKRRMLRRTVLR